MGYFQPFFTTKENIILRQIGVNCAPLLREEVCDHSAMPVSTSATSSWALALNIRLKDVASA